MADFNLVKLVQEEDKDYDFKTKSGSNVDKQCKLLTIIYNDFSLILEKNGKVTENDLKEIYLKYDKELRSTQLYSSSLYNPSQNVYYYISSPPFKVSYDDNARIEITCIYLICSSADAYNLHSLFFGFNLNRPPD